MLLQPQLVNFDERWGSIRKTIIAVLTMKPVKKDEWNERFSDVYALCTAKPEPLGKQLYNTTAEFFRGHAEILFKKIQECSGLPTYLPCYLENWTRYSDGSTYINLLYRYLNTSNLAKRKKDHTDHIEQFVQVADEKNGDALEIGHLALNIWKECVIDPLTNDLIRVVMDGIRKDRDGNASSESVLHGVINTLIDVKKYEEKLQLELYQKIFEQPLVQETKLYYQKEANQLRETLNCSQFMQKVDVRLAEEKLRVRRFLHPTSYEKVSEACQEKLVEDHLSLLQDECQIMIKDECASDLCRMYKLLKPVNDALSVMLKEFEEHTVNTGLASVKALYTENGTEQFVVALLNIHEKFTNLTETTFNNDQLFLGARDKACTKIVNHRIDKNRPCKSPELLAKYCDSLLRKSTKGHSEQEIDDRLNNVIVIFKYIDDKDVFQTFYSQWLAKRLIHNQSVSMDSEEAMINRLKVACGYEYTNKLHRMFTDMSISQGLNSNFSDHINKKNINITVSHSFLVLQCGAWPLKQASSAGVLLPNNIVHCIQSFETFYNEKFNGRKLSWLHNLSNGELKLSYLKKPYIVLCTSYQTAILLLYNNSDSLDYGEISEMTQMGEKELNRTLQSLHDVKLLEKSPPDESDLSKCCFSLMMNFSNKRTKFKITSAIQKDTSQSEIEQTHTTVDEDRKMYIQATIVRIMKSRKVLKHGALIEQVIDQSKTRFSPNVGMIKKSIEALIDKQYIERMQGKKDEYSYVA